MLPFVCQYFISLVFNCRSWSSKISCSTPTDLIYVTSLTWDMLWLIVSKLSWVGLPSIPSWAFFNLVNHGCLCDIFVIIITLLTNIYKIFTAQDLCNVFGYSYVSMILTYAMNSMLPGALFLDDGIELADRIFGGVLYDDDTDLLDTWQNLPVHPLQVCWK